MNITKENIDDLNLVLKLKFTEEDYADKVTATLKDYRKKANVPGFRAGMVPMGMVKKLYGKAVLAEEVNKLMSESLSKYLVEEKLPILGEPLPSVKAQKPLDFDNDKEFEFAFEVGLSPKVEVNLSKEETLPYYEIEVDENMLNQVIESHCNQHGKFDEVDVVEGGENLRGDMAQLDAEGNVLEGGVQAQDVLIALQVVKDEDALESFKGANLNEIITIDIKKAFPNDADRAALLKVEKDVAESLESNFQFTIKKIERFAKAEVNQELFDKVYGEGTVSSEEEYHAKIKEEVTVNFAPSSDYKFGMDLKNSLLESVKPELPSAFLRRWLKAANSDNEKLTDEIFEKEFPSFEESTKWQIIKDEIFKSNEMKIEDEELEAEAMKTIQAQFAQYGLPMGSIPEETMKGYAQEILKKEEERRKIVESLFERKVIAWAKEQVTLDVKPTTRDEFDKLFAPDAEAQAEAVVEALEESAE